MVVDAFGDLVSALLGPPRAGTPLPAVDPALLLADAAPVEARLTAAFLVALAGPAHPLHAAAVEVLDAPHAGASDDLVALYRTGLAAAWSELAQLRRTDPSFDATVAAARAALERALAAGDARATIEALWSVWFPSGVGLTGRIDAAVVELRDKRLVTVDAPNPAPITDPGREVLFTSNVLLGLPLDPVQDAAIEDELRPAVDRAGAEPQRSWFDHPIPMGIEPDRNELLYGLRGLDRAVAFEARRRGDEAPARATCLLSVSVTHAALRPVARRYAEMELARGAPLDHLDVLVVSELEARRLVDEVVGVAADRFVGPDGDPALLDIVGVDGEYGRHYSFLKAIAAVWHVVVDPEVRATFKIDLDQVFDQDVLVAETGRSAFEHLATPLWGATGRDAEDRPIELGMLAGALVNERDISRGLFTPDVPVPERPLRPDEMAFASAVPQAVSTRAEMMERYGGDRPDGVGTALERVHVTGGTTGILVDALRRHRPFTPSFVGRAEDQAYVLSVLGTEGPRLAYVHAAGLIMRHDKEAFAGDAIAAAETGKLIGDDIRILVFSAYARALAADPARGIGDVEAVQRLLDPFTGAFVSRLPTTVVLLRFALRLAARYASGHDGEARDLARLGAPRIREALRMTEDERFAHTLARERRAWDRFHDGLDALEAAIGEGDPAALGLRDHARAIIESCRVSPERPRPAAVT